jgi:hypothetical protein
LLISLQRLWRGEMPLKEAFWRYMITYDLILNIVATLAALIVILNNGPIAIAAIVHVLPVPYSLLAAIGTWRSADRGLENSTLVKIIIMAWVIFLLVV